MTEHQLSFPWGLLGHQVTLVQSLILVRLAVRMVMWGRLHAGRQASLYQQADVSPAEAYTVCSPWGSQVIALSACVGPKALCPVPRQLLKPKALGSQFWQLSPNMLT